MNRFGHAAFEPVWKREREFLIRDIPNDIRGWLNDPFSLTSRIVEHCQGSFSVKVIAQSWRRPMFNEALRLGTRPEYYALVREVYLLCNDEAWVYARTVIPHTTLQGPQRYLAHLGTRPLGSVLFADPGMRRDPVEIACIKPHHRIFRTATSQLDIIPDSIWGRRSVFYTGGKPLLVNEVFLPPLKTKI
jgi:chorismate--pyruvate lyase